MMDCRTLFAFALGAVVACTVKVDVPDVGKMPTLIPDCGKGKCVMDEKHPDRGCYCIEQFDAGDQ